MHMQKTITKEKKMTKTKTIKAMDQRVPPSVLCTLLYIKSLQCSVLYMLQYNGKICKERSKLTDIYTLLCEI